MRILVNSAAFLLATSGFVEAQTIAGKCLNWSYNSGKTTVSQYTGSTGTQVPWFVELTLSAVQRATDNNPTQFPDVAAVADAGRTAYTTGGLLVAQNTNRNDQLTTGLVTDSTFRGDLPDDCRGCILSYANAVYNMTTNGTLPEACKTFNGIFTGGVPSSNCLYGLSQAIANFDSCTGSSTTDLALGTGVILTSTGARCTAPQIADLEGRFGIYQNIMNYALFNSYVDSGFPTAYKALPCFAVIDSAIRAFSTPVKTTLAVENKCGTAANTAAIFSNPCTNEVVFGGLSVAEQFGSWAQNLGGGVTIRTTSTRCSAAEIGVLSNFSLYDVMIQCSRRNAPGNAAWATCLGDKWTALANALDNASTNKFGCSACFRDTATAIKGDLLLTNKCAPSPATSFSSLCLLQVAANRINDDIFTCSGVKMNVATTVGSSADIAANPAQLNSVVPFIRLARGVMGNSTLTSRNARLASVLEKISTVPMFGNMSKTAPFASCYGALTMEIVSNFDQFPDVVNSCSDEYAAACLTNSRIVDSLNKFQTCAGITMLTTSPYNCNAAQFKYMTDNGLPKYIYTQAISTPGVTIASVMNTILTNVTTIQKANNVTLPCANCLEDVVTGLFNLGDTIKATCSALDPSACLRLPAVLGIMEKFGACSNQTFDVNAAVGPVTTTNAPGTTSTSNDAPVTSVFVGAVTIALSALLL